MEQKQHMTETGARSMSLREKAASKTPVPVDPVRAEEHRKLRARAEQGHDLRDVEAALCDMQPCAACLGDTPGGGVCPACYDLIAARIEASGSLRQALVNMRFAYVNKDGDVPHAFELEALDDAEQALGTKVGEAGWNE